MKKIILIALYSLLFNTPTLYSQYKDSAALAKEWDRVNRLVDSMRPVLAARDSESKARWEEIAQKSNRVMEDHKQKEIEEATKEVIQRQEKEQKSKRNTILLAGAAFVITIAVAAAIRRRNKGKNQSV